MRKSERFLLVLLTVVISLSVLFVPLAKVYAAPDDNNTTNGIYNNNIDNNTIDNNTIDNNTVNNTSGGASLRNVQGDVVTITFSNGLVEEDANFTEEQYWCLDFLDDNGILTVEPDDEYNVYNISNADGKLLMCSINDMIILADDVSSADNIEYTLTEDDKEYFEGEYNVSKIIIKFDKGSLPGIFVYKLEDGLVLNSDEIEEDDVDIVKLMIAIQLLQRKELIVFEEPEDDEDVITISNTNGKPLFTITRLEDDAIIFNIVDGVTFRDNIEVDLTMEERAALMRTGKYLGIDLNCNKFIFSFGDVPELTILDGGDQTYIIGSGETITIAASGDLEDFTGVKLNGVFVNQDNYKTEAGSTVVTFNNDYLDSLTPGVYEVAFVYDYGEVSTNLTIVEEEESESNSVKAGDTGIILWVAMAVISLGMVVAIIKK